VVLAWVKLGWVITQVLLAGLVDEVKHTLGFVVE